MDSGSASPERGRHLSWDKGTVLSSHFQTRFIARYLRLIVESGTRGRFETTEEMGVQKRNQQACRSIRINCEAKA